MKILEKLANLVEATKLDEASNETYVVFLDSPSQFDPCSELLDCEGDYEEGVLASAYVVPLSDPTSYEDDEVFIEGAMSCKEALDKVASVAYLRGVPSDKREGVYSTYELNWGNNTPPRLEKMMHPPAYGVMVLPTGKHVPVDCDTLKTLADEFGWRVSNADCRKLGMSYKDKPC